MNFPRRGRVAHRRVGVNTRTQKNRASGIRNRVPHEWTGGAGAVRSCPARVSKSDAERAAHRRPGEPPRRHAHARPRTHAVTRSSDARRARERGKSVRRIPQVPPHSSSRDRSTGGRSRRLWPRGGRACGLRHHRWDEGVECRLDSESRHSPKELRCARPASGAFRTPSAAVDRSESAGLTDATAGRDGEHMDSRGNGTTSRSRDRSAGLWLAACAAVTCVLTSVGRRRRSRALRPAHHQSDRLREFAHGKPVFGVGHRRQRRSVHSGIRHRHQRPARWRRSRSRSRPTRPRTTSTSTGSGTTAGSVRARSRRCAVGHPAADPARSDHRRRLRADRLPAIGRVGLVERAGERRLGSLHRTADPQRHDGRQPHRLRRA